jgi:2,4-dienoyl-CoA reductase-like NADH-dependent reductase (Old Yellow Enzyme family)
MTGSPALVLGRPLELPCGVTLGNRFLKSAMSEVLATRDNEPTRGLARLYGAWAEGGCGLVITGNVMIDRQHLGEPRNLVIDDERDLKGLRAIARAGTRGGTQLWVQLNHPGKQIPLLISATSIAPSAVPLGAGLENYFAPPRAMTSEEVEGVVARFARSAEIAQRAGFSGVQIHGAHGYLVSQFLSPHHNRRTDRWGGDLEGRMRFVLEVYAAIRAAVGAAFPVGIKLNSADFQKGGFSEEDSLEVAARLADAGIDLIEISGGNYEAPAMTGYRVRKSTQEREAYFLGYAERLRSRLDLPLAVTGGFRSASGMSQAIASGAVDLVGLARPMAIDPWLPAKILAGEDYHSQVRHLTTGFRAVDALGMVNVTWYEHQLARIAQGRKPNPRLGVWLSIARTVYSNGVQSLQRRRG